MMKYLYKHQRAWLNSRPHRTEEWLRARLAEGFHVHHRDGDPTNNAPENLVLLDYIDHAHVHGRTISAAFIHARARQAAGIAVAREQGVYRGRPENVERNTRIAQRLTERASWTTIQREFGCSRGTVAKIARRQRP